MKAALKFIFLILVLFGASACSEKRKEAPAVLVVFGATGDLTAKKILPAVEKLAGERRLPEKFAVVAVARRAEAEFRKQISYPHSLFYHQASFEEDAGYAQLVRLLDKIDRDFGAKSNRIYFLATQPSHFSTIVEKLDQHGLIYKPGQREWSRVMIEKPFGTDLKSALELQREISQHLDESQIYRIDHYLGKEGVQNLIDFRRNFDDSLWNRDHIDRVDVVLSEEIGIGTRAKLWEETGLLRDVVQNHIMQLLSLATMEVGEDVPAEKIKALNAIRPLEQDLWVRGQYGRGIINGLEVVGYKEEKDVPSTSTAETFIAGDLYIDNDRWKGVPFHIQAGKRLPKQMTELVVHFKSKEPLHIRIQPQPAIFFEGSKPFNFKQFSFSEAYQKLIYDCLHGDQISFVQKEEQLAAWKLLTPVLEEWKGDDQIATYPAGTWGPN